jgi:hypothetical protein
MSFDKRYPTLAQQRFTTFTHFGGNCFNHCPPLGDRTLSGLS